MKLHEARDNQRMGEAGGIANGRMGGTGGSDPMDRIGSTRYGKWTPLEESELSHTMLRQPTTSSWSCGAGTEYWLSAPAHAAPVSRPPRTRIGTRFPIRSRLRGPSLASLNHSQAVKIRDPASSQRRNGLRQRAECNAQRKDEDFPAEEIPSSLSKHRKVEDIKITAVAGCGEYRVGASQVDATTIRDPILAVAVKHVQQRFARCNTRAYRDSFYAMIQHLATTELGAHYAGTEHEMLSAFQQ
ncbi:hypothetical protein HYALB_00002410 [Hymenoscyphus albidus]|uniref:Uncharacterized protein n=1 Tax=Hymenoscyphus albidus TaxID=595503 RepID=A0A9N9LJ45_9HELO|nr:hypothetical protein HYALB_00002410 [Hymenoscyphus albidus]